MRPMTPTNRQLTLREFVAALIAIGLTIFVIWDLYGIATGGSATMKEAFQLVSSIFVAVVGYYFGHIPAAVAQQSAAQSAARAQAAIDDTRSAVNDYVNRVMKVAAGPSGGGGAAPLTNEVIAILRDMSQDLSNRIKNL